METTEITRLQNEIARLNSIIDALIGENNLLKREIALLKQPEANLKAGIPLHENKEGNLNSGNAYHNLKEGNHNVENANHNLKEGNPNAGNTYHNLKEGNPNVGNTYHNLKEGNPNAGNTYHNLKERNPNVGNTYHNLKEGNLNTENAYHNLKEGNTNSGNVIHHNMVGNTKPQESNPINTKPGIQHTNKLMKHLGDILHVRTPKTGKYHTALLLLHFYNSNRGSHAELMKVTGMKLGGLTKQLANLKKRGWIVRSGWQQFSLTDVARKMVEEGVWGNLTT